MPIQEFHPLQTIDLSQQNGNVFALLGIVSRLAPTFDKNFKEISTEMISADYANAVFVFNREFGEFFNIILPPYLSLQDLENAHKKATMSFFYFICFNWHKTYKSLKKLISIKIVYNSLHVEKIKNSTIFR